jgi:hypothetical protein
MTMPAFIRRWLPMTVLLGGASALLLLTDQASAWRSIPAVAVLQQVSTPLLDDAIRGMLDGLAEKGFIDGQTGDDPPLQRRGRSGSGQRHRPGDRGGRVRHGPHPQAPRRFKRWQLPTRRDEPRVGG